MINSKNLSHNIRYIPFIVNGNYNNDLVAMDGELSCYTLGEMKKKSPLVDQQFLDSMVLYSLIWNTETIKPIAVSGVKKVSEDVVELGSKKHIFEDYNNNYEIDILNSNLLGDHYPFKYIAFDSIPNIEPFEGWRMHHDAVELLEKDNYKYLMYTGSGMGNPKLWLSQIIR